MASENPNPYQSPLSTEAPPSPIDGGQPGTSADRSARLLASIVDVFLVLLVCLPAVYLSGYFQRVGTYSETWFDELASSVLWLSLHYLIHGYWLATRGQTVGKRVMGIRIEDRSTGSLTPFFRIVFLRDFPLVLLAYVAPIFAFRTIAETWGVYVYLIDILFIFFTSRRCLHDRIANTKVVRIWS